MARADLLVDLVEAEQHGDRRRFQAVVEAIIAEERAKQHHVVADRLSEIITTVGSEGRMPSQQAPGSASELLLEVVPRRRLEDLKLKPAAREAVTELVEEHQRTDLLRNHGLEPRHRVLLEGPPGNGKTTLAEAIAAEVMLPLYVIRYEGIVSSFLGETASRLDQALGYVRSRRCVVLFDEFDAIAKERADAHETGEIKRVVSTLLLQIDRLPTHVIVVGSTNHPELLDRAAWRRFQLRLRLDAPTRRDVTGFLDDMQRRLHGDLGYASRTLADKLSGASYAEIEQFAIDVRRRFVLELPDADLRDIADRRLRQWRTQAGP